MTPRFADTHAEHRPPPLARGPPTPLQENLGKLCTPPSHHCHVEDGP
jgi:hypothetical protein